MANPCEFDWYLVLLLCIFAIGIAIILYSIDGPIIPLAVASLFAVDRINDITNDDVNDANDANDANDVNDTLGGADGGADEINVNNALIIPDNAMFVLDGHNLIHDLISKSKIPFDDGLEKLCNLLDEITSKDIHIVVKNPPDKKLKEIYKTKDEYLKSIMTLSKQHPNITYHIAYKADKNTAPKEHHTKGRDDFLTIHLSKSGYIVSRDKYRDYKKFATIKPFTHYMIKSGKQASKEKINPEKLALIDKPTVGSHLYYKFVNKAQNSLLSGKVIVDKAGENSTLYLAV